MKHFMLLIAIAFFSFSCEKPINEEKVIKENVSKHIQAEMVNPETFKFNSLRSVSKIDNKEKIKEERIQLIRQEMTISMGIAEAEVNLECCEKGKEAEWTSNWIKKQKNKLKALERQGDSLLQLQKSWKEKDFVTVTADYYYRAVNESGEDLLTLRHVELDKNLNVIKIYSHNECNIPHN